jgi:type I restriction enzyme S subunit
MQQSHASWPDEEIRAFASIGTGARDTQDRVPNGRYPFFVRSQKVERIDSWSFDGEAVLTAGDGVGTGKVFHYINGRFDYHQRVYRLSNFRSDVLGRYFFHQFSRNFLARIVSLTAKSSVDSVRMETIAGMRILLPSRDEQERIAAAIDDAEGLIAALEHSIAKKRAIRQGMMQALLTGRTRLAGFTNRWPETSLGDVATLQRGFDLPTRLRQRGSVPIVSSSGVSGWHDQAMVKAPGVVTGRYGTIGEVFFETADFWPLNTTLWVSNFHGNDARFIYYLLQRVDFASHSGKSGVPGVNRNDLHSEMVSLPELVTEQRAIVEALDDVERDLAALLDRLAKAQGVKTGITQQLLTGRTRLPVQETAA